MAALKGLVFGMAGLIVVGMGLVAWGMFRQADSLAERRDGFGAASLAVPADCRLAEVTAGPRDLLLLRIDGPVEQGCRRVLLVESATGRLHGQLDLTAE